MLHARQDLWERKNKRDAFLDKEEYMKFIEAVADKPISFYALKSYIGVGVRMGELLALTPADFDFQACTIRINKSYQRLGGRILLRIPKTARVIA